MSSSVSGGKEFSAKLSPGHCFWPVFAEFARFLPPMYCCKYMTQLTYNAEKHFDYFKCNINYFSFSASCVCEPSLSTSNASINAITFVVSLRTFTWKQFLPEVWQGVVRTLYTIILDFWRPRFWHKNAQGKRLESKLKCVVAKKITKKHNFLKCLSAQFFLF